MDKILTDYVDRAFETGRLRRNSVQATRDRILAEMLIELEEAGDAMRFVDAEGRIAWKPTLRRSNVLNREPTTIRFCIEAMKANLLRLQNEWEAVEASRDRGAIYQYLSAVFQTVTS